MMDNRHKHRRGPRITRRGFLGTGAAGGAALLASGWSSLLSASAASPAKAADESAPWFEASIPHLQELMASGALTSRGLTQAYLARIDRLNPILNAVIETNPNAVSIATRLDAERRAGQLRGPLHGIPVLLKDNVATGDTMQTTAGSLALVNSKVPGDAPIVASLRKAGAVILGKANLSEWANFRGFSYNGWSGRGGLTINPYLKSFDTSGSSSGSAVAAAANLCAATIGTETDGSIVSPSGNNLIVGLKPTVGLVPQGGIVPIGHSQDTAGPMCRTVTDVAIMLGVIQAPFGEAAGATVPADYAAFLDKNALAGARIGVDPMFFEGWYGPGDPGMVTVAYHAVDVMQSLGATIVQIPGILDPMPYPEWDVLLFEFKVQIAEYLQALSHTSVRTLADLIAFDQSHCWQEMRWFGQEIFEMAETTSGDLTDPAYLTARAQCLALARTQQMDVALQQVDAIVAPSWGWISSPPAVAGYPNLCMPAGITPDGLPTGLCITAGFLEEPKLIGFAYALEQALQARVPPTYAGTARTMAEAGICTTGKPHKWYGGMGRPRGPFRL